MILLRLFALLLALAAPLSASPLVAQDTPDELVLEGENIITVTIAGQPVRLEVSAESFGAPLLNPATVQRLGLLPEARRGWRFGPVLVEGAGTVAPVDFGRGGGPVPLALSWASRPASAIADGTIGVHHLPYARVSFILRPSAPQESLQRFPLKRAEDGNTRLGTEVTIGKRRLMMIFTPRRAENLVTAPTANFIATHQEGGFVPGSDGIAVMQFAVERPTRIMRIAHAIELGELLVDRFAVRVEDYGEPSRVGEIGENDPRFEKGRILVSRRKGRGRPDLLTRIGSDQIAHCSQITYDLAAGEIRLSCAPLPQDD
jgi:hypothetical protein